MNLRQSFNLACALQLDRVKTFGYRRAVEFRPSLAGVPLPTQVASDDVRSPEEERSGRQPKYKPQLHRTNRNPRYFTAEARRLKQESNERYRARRKALRMARAQLVMVWPEQES